MSYSEFIKTQVKHQRCVVCAKTFKANYDEVLKSFPVYHETTSKKHSPQCETIFFTEIIRIYRYLHESEQSMSIRRIIESFSWNSRISMRKEMMEWCIRQGYFEINELKRLEVPPVIQDSCKELFAELDFEDEERVQHAIDLLRAAFRCFSKDLRKPSEDEIPIQRVETERGETMLYTNIDITNVSLRREKEGMVTIEQSGAKEVDKRMHTASRTMERRRYESKK